MLSYNYMCNLARLQLRAGPATADDITITPLPLFHMNAMCVGVLSNILVGARVLESTPTHIAFMWNSGSGVMVMSSAVAGPARSCRRARLHM